MDWTTEFFFQRWDTLSRDIADDGWAAERGYYALAVYCGQDFFPKIGEGTLACDFLNGIETGLNPMNFFLRTLLPESSTFWKALEETKKYIMSRKKGRKKHERREQKAQVQQQQTKTAVVVKQEPKKEEKPKDLPKLHEASKPLTGKSYKWEEDELKAFLAKYDTINKSTTTVSESSTK